LDGKINFSLPLAGQEGIGKGRKCNALSEGKRERKGRSDARFESNAALHYAKIRQGRMLNEKKKRKRTQQRFSSRKAPRATKIKAQTPESIDLQDKKRDFRVPKTRGKGGILRKCKQFTGSTKGDFLGRKGFAERPNRRWCGGKG